MGERGMPVLDRDGVAIHYEISGDTAGERGADRPLVLLTHGFSGSSAMWRDNVPALVAAGYRVLVWDMRGHGRSASPADPARYSAALTVGDIDALLDAAGAEQAVVAGMPPSRPARRPACRNRTSPACGSPPMACWPRSRAR